MAAEVEIGFFSGNTVRLNYTVADADNPPAAKDLTGATNITFIIAKEQGKTPALSLTLGSGVTVVTPLDGEFRVDLTPAQTEPLKGTMYHEARVTDSSGNVSTVAYGGAVIEKNSIMT